MEELFTRFPHISEKIFNNMNIKSLENCRKVSKSWLKCIDDQNILWNKIAKNKDGNQLFQSACRTGQSKMARALIRKSAELKIDLNAEDKLGTIHILRKHVLGFF